MDYQLTFALYIPSDIVAAIVDTFECAHTVIKCSAVSREWRALILDREWRRATATMRFRQYLGEIARSYKFYRYDFSDCYYLTDGDLSAIPHCTHVKILDGPGLTDGCMQHLAAVVDLDMSHCRGITGSGFGGLKSVRKIDVTECSGVDGDHMSLLPGCCGKITTAYDGFGGTTYGVIASCTRVRMQSNACSHSYMLKMLLRCRTVDARGWTDLCDANLPHLASCQKLYLDNKNIHIRGQGLKRMPNLKIVNYYGRPPQTWIKLKKEMSVSRPGLAIHFRLYSD